MYAERGAPTSWNALGQPVIVAQPLTAHPLLSVYQQQVGVNAHEFWVRRPGKETLKFDFKVFDDPILCPMVRPAVPVIRRRLHSTDRPCFGRRQGLFDPRVFDLETKLTERERGRPSSVEDEVDGTFLLDQPVRTCVFPSMTSPFRLQELPLMPYSRLILHSTPPFASRPQWSSRRPTSGRRQQQSSQSSSRCRTPPVF